MKLSFNTIMTAQCKSFRGHNSITDPKRSKLHKEQRITLILIFSFVVIQYTLKREVS